MRLHRSSHITVLLVIFYVWASRAAQAGEGFLIGTPTKLGPAVNTGADEYGPAISDDGLSLYFQRGPFSSGDIYVATRDAIDSPWRTARRLDAPINSRWDDRNPDVSSDHQTLYFSSSRPGGSGDNDIWVSKWNPEAGSWGDPENLLEPVNSRYWDTNPHLSADGSLYFQSTRRGTYADMWVSRRTGKTWGEPELLFEGGRSPSVSGDGLMLFSTWTRGNSDVYVSTRERIGDQWGPRVSLGPEVNTSSNENGSEISADGSMLYWSRGDLWQAPLLPLESVSLQPGSAPYSQNFDEALGVDGRAARTDFPAGWTTSENGIVFQNATMPRFPVRAISIQTLPTFNAGKKDDSDRALAIGVTRQRNPDIPMLQFLSELAATDAAALQLQFDLEAWLGENRADTPGEAAFDVLLEVDSGEGFSLLHEFSNVSTGPILSPPEGGGILDGNLDENRVSFDSGVQMAAIPAGSALRIRWEVPESSETRGWVFGLDDVELNLFDNLLDAFDCNTDGSLDVLDANCSPVASLDGTLSAANLIKGDADADGQVQFSDFVILANNFDTPGQYTDGDFDKSGQIDFADFVILANNFGQSAAVTAAVPEPSALSLLIIGLLAAVLHRRGSSQ